VCVSFKAFVNFAISKDLTMKKLALGLLATAAMAAAVVPVTVNAANVSSVFNVQVNLTSACRISTAPGAVTFNYTAFDPDATAGTGFAVQCTNTMPYTFQLDATTGTLLDLTYNLTVLNAAGTAAAAGGTGSGFPQSYSIGGTLTSGAGTCGAPVGTPTLGSGASSCTAFVQRTLYIVY
jgi:hypothetical protein